MLTIISKFNNFRNRQGEYYTTEDLTKLSKAVITSDVIHFKGNISYGFNSTVANCIYKYIDNKYKKGKILIINDFSLHMTDKLIDEGFDINNIYLAYGKWAKNADLDKDQYVYETMKKHIEVSFKEKLNVIKLEDIFNMQFDLIIANPPYGRIGAQITKKIINDVDYNQYINLEPGNDYFITDNYKYLIKEAPIVVVNGFEDAAQTTTIAKLQKGHNDLTEVEARLLLQIRHSNPKVKKAIDEYIVLASSYDSLFTSRFGKRLAYSPDLFTFNSGGFDIIHGYFAVARRDLWTDSTNYNIFQQEYKNGSEYANCLCSKVKGCKQFKKLIYSEFGLKWLKVLFSCSPEGWGKSMFPNVDYSNCKTWLDLFNFIGLSKDSIDTIIEETNRQTLNKKEKEICEIAKKIL